MLVQIHCKYFLESLSPFLWSSFIVSELHLAITALYFKHIEHNIYFFFFSQTADYLVVNCNEKF